MTILAFDFSSSQRSVAVVGRDQHGRGAVQAEVVDAGGRSTRAFQLVERVLAEAHLEREAIDTIAVGLGPGSYTGIRASIAVAQGWALARPVEMIGIPSVEVLATQTQKEGVRGLVHFVIDAQRGEFYRSSWELGEGDMSETQPLEIVSRDVILRALEKGKTVRGPDLAVAFATATPLHPSARCLGIMALEGGKAVSGAEMKPVYLRQTTFVKAPPPKVRLGD